MGFATGVLLKMDAKLDAIARVCAAHQGVGLSEWLRQAAHERALRQAAGDGALLRLLALL